MPSEQMTPSIAPASAPIRVATWEDFQDAMAMCRELYDENAIFPADWEMVSTAIKKATNREFGIMGLIGSRGAVEAASLLLITRFWYTDVWHLEELFNYVRPEFRRSTHAKRLLDWTKKTSDELNLPLITGVISNERTAAKVKLYERRFGPMKGAFFVHWPSRSDEYGIGERERIKH